VPPENTNEEISYVSVDTGRQEEEELPRKLPRKPDIDLSEDNSTKTKKEYPTWDFTPAGPSNVKTSTVLERPSQPRYSVEKAFPKKSGGETSVFRHIHTLRSHLSPVRALIPCNSAPTLPEETCFISAGDDSTVKFWRVSRAGSAAKKKGNFDILPQITFRGHSGIVTCLAESVGNIWSGGSDGGIRGWETPSATRDAYGPSSICAI
jgi:WD40 repeat protein